LLLIYFIPEAALRLPSSPKRSLAWNS